MIPRLKPNLGMAEFLTAFLPANQDNIIKFEQAFSDLMGVKHAIAFPYGRTGLYILLQALGLKNKEIICPAYTCVVVPHAIVTSENEPIFIDSNEADFNMNLELAYDAVEDNTGAIIATSIFGYPVNLDLLDNIKKAYPHLKIIQDCAHSFGAEWKGRPVHKAGDAAIFGLNISKLITSIFGGMVTTDDDTLADKLKYLREKKVKSPTWFKSWQRRAYLLSVYPTFSKVIYGIVNKLERSSLLDNFVKYYDESKIDMPSDYLVGLTPIEAKVGLVQISKYEMIISNRRRAAEFYHQNLQDIDGLKLPPLVHGSTYSHYVPRSSKKQELIQFALKKGVQLGDLIEYSIPEMEAYRNRPGEKYPCPLANELSKTTINLPVWSKNYKDLKQIVKNMKLFFDKSLS